MIHHLLFLFKMMSLEPLIDDLCREHVAVFDNFLPYDLFMELHDIAFTLYHQDEFKQAGIGQENMFQQDKTIRRDKICWLDKYAHLAAVQLFTQALETLMLELNKHLFLALVDYETQFAMHPPGSFYKKHRDQFHHDDSRRISCVYYLNLNWQESMGGELMIYHEDKTHSIMPKGNRLATFTSHLLHEVLPTHDYRASLTTWFKVRALGA